MTNLQRSLLNRLCCLFVFKFSDVLFLQRDVLLLLRNNQLLMMGMVGHRVHLFDLLVPQSVKQIKPILRNWALVWSDAVLLTSHQKTKHLFLTTA